MLWLIGLLSIFLVVTACSNNSSSEAQADGGEQEDSDGQQAEFQTVDMSEPMTLKINDHREAEQFAKDFKDPIEAEFPNITVEQLQFIPALSSMEEQFAAGNVPDILMAPDFRYLPLVKEGEIAYDMTELIETYGFENLDRYDQGFLDIVRSYSEDGTELWGLPFMQNKAALHYNKDIFDMFGVEYPTDDMTYEEVIALAKKVTGEIQGTYYTGLAMPSSDRYLFPALSITLVNPETDAPQFTTEPEIKMILETYKRVNEFQEDPGNPRHGDGAATHFIGEQRLAMLPMYFLGLEWTGLLDAQEQGLNWDIVTFPKWEGQGDVSGFNDGYWIGVSSASEVKPQALKVIEFLLSDEQVKNKIRYPEESIYTDEQFFAMSEDMRDPLLADKNVEALYKHPAPPAPEGRSKYEEIAKGVLSERLNEFLTTNIDVNTLLRELQEEAEIRITNAKEAE